MLARATIVSFMVSAATGNEMWLVMRDALVGGHADLEPAKIAFQQTRGDFATRFAAAVDALFARLVQPKLFINIPDHAAPRRPPQQHGHVPSRPHLGNGLLDMPSIADRAYRRQATSLHNQDGPNAAHKPGGRGLCCHFAVHE